MTYSKNQPDILEHTCSAASAPLAERLRPKHLNEVVGQAHLLGKGKPLRIAFESGRPHSMIFWGPPGVGKTTLARLMADGFDARFVAISAVLSGVKDIREAVAQAEIAQQQGHRTILFVDEVHRFNKAQQDAFLPFVESGLLTFIGATTENPSFEVIPALLSRARVYILELLKPEELKILLNRALDLYNQTLEAKAGDADTVAAIKAKTASPFIFHETAREQLCLWADGDARRLINTVEVVLDSAHAAKQYDIDEAWLENALSQNMRRFDKGGDAFYDQISALHKSVRGSDPDASLYWLCRMLDGGADPMYLVRRIVRMAWEDIGIADPRAAQIANNAAETYERLGSPEGELALAQAVIYMAIAPKSNAGYMAYNRARSFVRQDKTRAVPIHLRNAPTKLMKEIGFGKAYRYAHDEPNAFAAGETYLPEGMVEPGWYRPVDRGLEIKIGEKMAQLKQWNAQARQENPNKKD